MRILYGVFGYGRGHATRALGVLPALQARHDVLVIAGGDAHDTIKGAGHSVIPVETFRYAYGPHGERSLWTSFTRNAGRFRDLIECGPKLTKVCDIARSFGPDIALCDADPWVHRAAIRLRIPRISFDHYGLLAFCKPRIARRDWLRVFRDAGLYKAVVGKPERIIVSSFYGAPTGPGVRLVGPVLREEVIARKATREDFLLVYLNNGAHQLVATVEQALRSLPLPVVVYGTPREGKTGNLDYRPPSNDGFLDDLARCRAVFSTAGNQLVGEAIYFRKPMLVMAEHTVEQRMNALAVEQLGIGEQVGLREVNVDRILAFLANEDWHRERMVASSRDGRRESIEAIETCARELVSKPRSGAAVPAWSAA